MKEYTHDWSGGFIGNTHFLTKCKIDLCLEIGCFEGKVSNYIADNLLSEKGKLICIDPLTDQYLNGNLSEEELNRNNTEWSYFNNQYDRFVNNVSEYLGNKIELVRELSDQAFPKLMEKYEGKFDLIYVDGDHRAEPVYIDAINSFRLCKKGGFILFDDYGWTIEGGERTDDCKNGIDRFLKEYEGSYEVVSNGYQIMIRKK